MSTAACTWPDRRNAAAGRRRGNSAWQARHGKKLIIEARVNEYMMRDDDPNVPWTPDEIARAAAGAREAGDAREMLGVA